MTKSEQFFRVYSEELERAVRERPSEYRYAVAFVPTVVERMKAAMARKSFNKDGIAIQRTCKRLQIPYTYKGIDAVINSEECAQ